MNSIVGPIFIESFAEKKMFMDSVNSVQDPLKFLKSAGMHSQKKRKKKKERGERHTQLVFTYPNIY